MGKKKEVIRDYNFTDAVLTQLTDRTISNGTRDTAELDPQGVTAARLTALGLLNTDFLNMEDDEEWEGLVSEKVVLKNAAFEVCETGTRNIRRMAENIFGADSATYKRFGFDGINSLKDVERIKAYFRIFRRATDKQAQLAPEGLTAPVLAAFGTACSDANAAFDVVEDTVEERDIATEARITLGNTIYKEVVKICNTGKDYWFDKSESKYNDYVITESGEPPVQNFDINSGQVMNILDNVQSGDFGGTKIKNTSVIPGVTLYVYLANSANQTWTGIGINLNPGEEKVLDENDFGAILPFLNVYNGGGSTGSFRVTGL